MSRAAEAASSPLGRYTPFGRHTVDVVLLGLPVRLLDAARVHHDDVLREFRLVVLDGADGRGLPPRVAELAELFGRRYAASRPRRDEEVDDALARGDLRIDQVLPVPVSAGRAVQELEGLLREVDAMCAAGHLLTPPRPPLLRVFAAWYTAEVARQTAGEPARPWDGPLDL